MERTAVCAGQRPGSQKSNAWYDYQCSYADLIVDGDNLHLFLPHRWERVLHVRLKASDLPNLPTRLQFATEIAP